MTENKGKCALPSDFALTEQMISWARINVRGVDPVESTNEFVDYAHARDWRMRDWLAAWRNWLRKAGKAAAGKPYHSAPVSRPVPVIPVEQEPLPVLSEGQRLAGLWFWTRCQRAGGFNAGKDAIDKLRVRAYELAAEFDLLRSENDPEATNERLYAHLDAMLVKWNVWREKKAAA